MGQDKETSDGVMLLIKELCAKTDTIDRLNGKQAGFARWDDILAKAKEKNGYPAEDVEWAINSLMDAGLLYEPTLGIIKVI